MVTRWSMSTKDAYGFNRKSHITHFLLCLAAIPDSKVVLDTSRVAVAYYCLSGLDLLGELDGGNRKITEQDKLDWCDWIWERATASRSLFGFRSGTSIPRSGIAIDEKYDPPHLVMTYTALLSLSILRDNFSRLNRQGLISFISSSQVSDGSFSSCPVGTVDSERDIRFTFCAFAISSMLNDWAGINIHSALDYITRCRTYEGGYGESPGREAQGGPTYCGLAALQLLAQKDHKDIRDYLTEDEIHHTVRWLVHKQRGGFQGRTGKEPDACYSFWCGASLKILHSDSLVNADSNAEFLSTCQFKYGGIGKTPEEPSDPYHTYLALASLSLYPPTETWLDSYNLARSSWEIHQLDPILNLGTKSALWARQMIPKSA